MFGIEIWWNSETIVSTLKLLLYWRTANQLSSFPQFQGLGSCEDKISWPGRCGRGGRAAVEEKSGAAHLASSSPGLPTVAIALVVRRGGGGKIRRGAAHLVSSSSSSSWGRTRARRHGEHLLATSPTPPSFPGGLVLHQLLNFFLVLTISFYIFWQHAQCKLCLINV